MRAMKGPQGNDHIIIKMNCIPADMGLHCLSTCLMELQCTIVAFRVCIDQTEFIAKHDHFIVFLVLKNWIFRNVK